VATRDILPNLVRPEITEEVDLVAVCDVVADRAREAAQVFGIPEFYAGHEAMLARSDIDAALVATPIPYHFPVALAAVRAGKHVYVQKTMATTLQEANTLLDAVRAAGVKLTASPGEMQNPGVNLPRVKEMIEAGAIGQVTWGYLFRSGAGHENEAERQGDGLMNVNPTWYYKQGGGPVLDSGVYSLHRLTGILGPVKKVTALSGTAVPVREWKGQRIDVEVDDQTLMLLDFGDGRYVALASTWTVQANKGLGMAIYGTKGTIHLEGSGFEMFTPEPAFGGPGWVNVPGPERLQGPGASGRHILADIMELVGCILQDREPTVATGEHARHVVEVIEKAYPSSRTGEAMKLTTSF
jgi:predicted dehydrogenase